MARALRLLTWHLPDLPAPLFSDPARGNSSRQAARAVLDLPAREQPDVIAFNGVVDRHTLIAELGPTYPFDTANMGGPPGSRPDEASGLMLFSRLPFLPLPIGGDTWYESFRDAPAPDLRGVGVVRVNGPYQPTTVAFTHTFGEDDRPALEHHDPVAIRELEFSFIRAVLKKVANGHDQNYANSVVVGDLSVPGETGQTLNERDKVFAGVPGTFGGDFDDGWRAAMHAPNDLSGHDPGYTQHATARASLDDSARFDYQCTRRNATVDMGLVPHQMRTPLRLTDADSGVRGLEVRPRLIHRWGLLAHLHRLSPHCSPSTAVELLKSPPANPGGTGSKVWLQATDFRDADMYHWVYIDSAGTYSVFTNPLVEVAAFRRSDLTHELKPTGILRTSELPAAVLSHLQGSPVVRPPHLADQGTVFSWREPFFLRIRGVSPQFVGQAPFAIVQHAGESAETALVLHPHLAVNPGLPQGQKLGTADECWFRADRPERFSRSPYDDRFVLANPARADVRVELRDAARVPRDWDSTGGDAAELELHRVAGAETIFLVLTRADVNQVGFSLTWDSPVSYLMLESIDLAIIDEVGPDWPGADELELTVTIDGESVYSNSWDEADTGNDWPDLAQDIRSAVVAKVGTPVLWAAFTDGIMFSVIKTDGLFAHGSVVGTLTPLTAADGDVVPRSYELTISDPAGDGAIVVSGEVRKIPPF
jgi:hypothetical protein